MLLEQIFHREDHEEVSPFASKLEKMLSDLHGQILRKEEKSIPPPRRLQDGDRYRTFPAGDQLLLMLWDAADAIRIPRGNLPVLSIPESFQDRLEEEGQIYAGYDHRHNVVHIPEYALLGKATDHYQLGDRMGEELFGHCYRQLYLFRYGQEPEGGFSLGGSVERGDVEEFFGYLGRKVLLRILEERGGVELFFPERKVTPPKNPDIVLDEVRRLRSSLDGWLLSGERRALEKAVAGKEGHRLGYAAAHALDISSLSWEDIQELYSLPTEEVARRYLSA